jgi:hypothetical protein
MPEFVVVDAEGKFLAGPRTWSKEYPDALVWEIASNARKAAARCGALCEVVEDYGLDSQKSVETFG